VGSLDVITAEIQINLIDPVSGPLVIDESPGAELGDCQEAGAGKELVTASTAPPGWDIG
jgi:hypothetical protein